MATFSLDDYEIDEIGAVVASEKICGCGFHVAEPSGICPLWEKKPESDPSVTASESDPHTAEEIYWDGASGETYSCSVPSCSSVAGTSGHCTKHSAPKKDEDSRTAAQILDAMDGETRQRVETLLGGRAEILDLVRRADKMYDEEEIRRWVRSLAEKRANRKRKGKNVLNLKKTLPYINSAIRILFPNLAKGLRPVQLITVALIVSKKEAAAGLQVRTGEGKSIIIATAAAFIALTGRKVDVHTSARNLAMREVAPGRSSKAPLFEMLGLTFAHNVNEGAIVIREPRPCYDADIVFGTTRDFCFDFLMHTFMRTGNLKARKFGETVAIIDEVDNMLVDQVDSVCRITGSVVGYTDIQAAFDQIWHLILHLRWVDDELQYMDYEHARCAPTNIEGLHPIRDLIKKDLFFFLAHKPEAENIICVSEFVAEFVRANADAFIESALTALLFVKIKTHYYIDEHKKVRIIDYLNTGEVTKSVWSNGLHQFVERKHGVEPSQESLETNFISYTKLLLFYGRNLCGVTGTLGSKACRKLLADRYHMQCLDIPTDRPCRRVDLPNEAVPAHKLNERVLKLVKEMFAADRPVLIICEDMRKVEDLSRALEAQFSGRVRSVRLEEDIEDNLEFGHREVCVATNLFGRGADIALTERAIHAGGLHVLMTFRPTNQRILDQAFGRSGRFGARGSASAFFPFYGAAPPAVFDEGTFYLYMRARMDSNALRDEVFRRFCEFLDSDPMFSTRNRQYSTIFRAAEERFGYFLKTHENPEELAANFERFKSALLREAGADGMGLLRNPALKIRFAIENQGDKALGIRMCQQALHEDPEAWRAGTVEAKLKVNSNTHDNIVYGKAECLAAIDRAIKLTEKAGERKVAELHERAVISGQRNSYVVHTMNHDPNAILDFVERAPLQLRNRGAAGEERGDVAAAQEQAPEAVEDLGTNSEIAAIDQNLQGLIRLRNAVERNDIADVAVEDGNWTDQARGSQEEYAMMTQGPPVPVKREKPRRRGGFWGALLAVAFGALCIIGGAMLLSFGPIGMSLGAALIASGVQDVLTGVNALVTGEGLDVGDFLRSKAKIVSQVVVGFLSMMTPESAHSVIATSMRSVLDQPAPPGAKEKIEEEVQHTADHFNAVSQELRDFDNPEKRSRKIHEIRGILRTLGAAANVEALVDRHFPPRIMSRFGVLCTDAQARKVGEEFVDLQVGKMHFEGPNKERNPLLLLQTFDGDVGRCSNLENLLPPLAAKYSDEIDHNNFAVAFCNSFDGTFDEQALYAAAMAIQAARLDACALLTPAQLAPLNLAPAISAFFTKEHPHIVKARTDARQYLIECILDEITEISIDCDLPK